MPVNIMPSHCSKIVLAGAYNNINTVQHCVATLLGPVYLVGFGIALALPPFGPLKYGQAQQNVP